VEGQGQERPVVGLQGHEMFPVPDDHLRQGGLSHPLHGLVEEGEGLKGHLPIGGQVVTSSAR